MFGKDSPSLNVINVSYQTLTDNPAIYHGKFIEISGFFHQEFEAVLLCNGIKPDLKLACIWLDWSDTTLIPDELSWKLLQNKKISLKGRFDSLRNKIDTFYKGRIDTLYFIKLLE